MTLGPGERSTLDEQGVRYVEVDTPSARVMRDLVSIRRDLALARQYTEAWSRHEIEVGPGAGRPDEGAFWVAALTMYGRAFGKGVRNRARVDLDRLSAEQRGQHEFFCGLRDKYVAHSVNGYERAHVFVPLIEREDGIVGAGTAGTSFLEAVPLQGADAANLIALCEFHLDGVNARMKVLRFAVQSEAVALGFDHLLALPSIEFGADVGSRDRVRQNRKP